MSREEYDWIDDAFDDSKEANKPDAQTTSDKEYDWIDDAFDASKNDPLAGKGMTGCSSLTTLLLGIAAIILLALLVFVGFYFYSTFGATSSWRAL